MALQTYWTLRGKITEEKNSPLIETWIKRLNLEEECIKIIEEHKGGYAGITLRFDNNANSWIIGNNGLNDYWILHKLGYLWIWNKLGYLERKKEHWNEQSNLYCLAESCVMDNIVFYHFCNTDLGFYNFWVGFNERELKHWYQGASWYKELPNMIYQYIVNYLNYFYVLPEDIQEKHSNYIMQELTQRRAEILEKAKIKSVYFPIRNFTKLNKLLRKFDKIVTTNNYRSVESYILQLQSFF